MRITPRLGLVIILGLTLMRLSANAAPVGDVLARPASEVSGADVKLGDIASVLCADAALGKKLKNAYICAAPLPGDTTKLTRAQIIVALNRNGLKGSAKLLAPDVITVKRLSNSAAGQAIFEAARDFALAAPWPGEVVVEPVTKLRDQATPPGKVEFRARSRAQKLSPGRNTLFVDVLVDGTKYTTTQVSILVRVFAPVLIATRAILKSEEIGAGNTRIERIEITDLPEDLIREPISKSVTATYQIAEGAAICGSWVEEPPVIRSGDNVVVTVVGRFVRVADVGAAVSAGAEGQVIKVRLSGSAREVRGTVVGPGQVEIYIDRRS